MGLVSSGSGSQGEMNQLSLIPVFDGATFDSSLDGQRLTKESDIQRTILDGLAAKRVFAFRLNTAAMKVGKRFFRAHSLGAGAADILALPRADKLKTCFFNELTGEYEFAGAPSGILWIECKTAKGTLSPEQESFRDSVKNRGHNYLVARSWEDVAGWLEAHGV